MYNFGRIAVMILIFMLAVFTASATPICVNTVPNMTVESQPVCTTIPGLGNQLFLPASNFTAQVYWEDLDKRTSGGCVTGLPGDCDYNDAKLGIVGNYSQNLLTLTFQGGLASYLNTLSWVGGSISVSRDSQGPVSATINWTPGTELLLQDFTSAGGHWYSGPGSRNVDCNPHAIVDTQASSVPEPATFILIGGGLVGLGLIRRHRRPKQVPQL
jgi:hypothetical protein